TRVRRLGDHPVVHPGTDRARATRTANKARNPASEKAREHPPVNSVGDSTGGLTPEITLRLFAPDDGKYTERAVGTPGVRCGSPSRSASTSTRRSCCPAGEPHGLGRN